MKKRNRLTRGEDFHRLISRARVYSGRGLVAFAVPRDQGPIRIGVTTSRRVKGSVARNRARRRLREAARLGLLADSAPGRTGIGYDVVLIARPAALELPFGDLEAEVTAVGRRLGS